MLANKYKIKEKGFGLVMEEIRQRIARKAVKVRRYSERVAQYEQNRLFSVKQKQFFRTLEGDTEENVPLNQEQATTFWSKL